MDSLGPLFRSFVNITLLLKYFVCVKLMLINYVGRDRLKQIRSRKTVFIRRVNNGRVVPGKVLLMILIFGGDMAQLKPNPDETCISVVLYDAIMTAS